METLFTLTVPLLTMHHGNHLTNREGFGPHFSIAAGAGWRRWRDALFTTENLVQRGGAEDMIEPTLQLV
jgi:hypothetical protein